MLDGKEGELQAARQQLEGERAEERALQSRLEEERLQRLQRERQSARTLEVTRGRHCAQGPGPGAATRLHLQGSERPCTCGPRLRAFASVRAVQPQSRMGAPPVRRGGLWPAPCVAAAWPRAAASRRPG